jgi:hypothetical protein
MMIMIMKLLVSTDVVGPSVRFCSFSNENGKSTGEVLRKPVEYHAIAFLIVGPSIL